MSAPAPDPDSRRYATWWEPVLAPPGRRLLERVDVVPRVYLDLGAGTGALVLAAARRWPEARVIALDASAGMLSVGRALSAAELPSGDLERLTWLPADAAGIPLDDASVDVATGAFMLQVVEDRRAVLREALRVLRPGGVFGLVTWLAGELVVPADGAFAEVVAAFRPARAEACFRPGRETDYETVEEARAELSVIGFGEMDLHRDELRHAWTREDYLDFKEGYDERDLFESLDGVDRERLRQALRDRWATLPEEAFEVRGPLVAGLARKPAAS